MIAVASLIVLIAVIAFSAVTKKNAGVVGLVAAYIFSIIAAKCGTAINVSKVVTGNWPTSVFFIVLATTFLFGIATLNGTTQALSKNIVCLARGNAKILPVIFFLFGAIILICGMSVLISVVNTCGGIAFLSDGLENIIGERTAQPIMMVLGGLMGAVSSGTGVVMPTLIPLSAELSQTLGISSMSIVIGVIVGTNGVVISPLSTVGGICVGCAGVC